MHHELSTKYDSHIVEEGKNSSWIKNGYFIGGKDKSKPAFSIVIPPPNVTGKLHLGHAWDTAIQDMLIRYKKMKGFDAVWIPGMDHAGIATQAKIEQRLRNQGLSRYDLGREKFLEYAWNWKKEYADHIHEQWGKLGLSLDYSRERFTLDEGLNNAVKHVFVTLYNKGIIYRGERIINWDPVQKTALSNIEVIYKESESNMYYFKYVLSDDANTYLEVATTRPETMFGDVCVVVNPKDPRYTKFIGKSVINPANGDILPIIADNYVDIAFGTGAMKCTPAHDPNDFTIGEKYGFAKICCMNPDGTMNAKCGKYDTMDRFVCRDTLVKDLESAGLLIKIEKYTNQVGHSERSDAIVEPYLSKQWFVKMKPLAEQSLAFQQTDDKINFVPERFEKIFENWMNGIEDWCISRQLWWGHRIPAWYNINTGETYVGNDAPIDIENWKQDEDVLDTWFSSALWPFSVFGWPEKTPDFERYFPTSCLSTAYDIIFFWVSRMIFQSLEFTGQKPFKDALIHGLIRDSQGRKMSKSLGNGIDPMDVIEEYGCDALRFFLTTNSAPGQDLRYSDEKVKAAWNFINKIWNSARFVMMNLPDDFIPEKINMAYTSTPDRWILAKLNDTIKIIDEFMDKYDFVMAGSYLYNFIWDDFCSWYLEMSKISLNDSDSNIVSATRNTLFYVLDAITKLIHPFMPFVSEEIYQKLHDTEDSICTTSWPAILAEYNASNNESTMNSIIEIITTIRAARVENGVAPNKLIDIVLGVKDSNLALSLQNNIKYIERFGFANSIKIVDAINTVEKGKSFVLSGIDMFLPLSGLVNIDEELARQRKEFERLKGEIERCEKMLSNPNFINKAPSNKIEEEQKKLEDYKSKLASVSQLIASLQ